MLSFPALLLIELKNLLTLYPLEEIPLSLKVIIEPLTFLRQAPLEFSLFLLALSLELGLLALALILGQALQRRIEGALLNLKRGIEVSLPLLPPVLEELLILGRVPPKLIETPRLVGSELLTLLELMGPELIQGGGRLGAKEYGGTDHQGQGGEDLF